jgi:DNA processing protein
VCLAFAPCELPRPAPRLGSSVTSKGTDYTPPKFIGEATLGRLLEGTSRRVPDDSPQVSLFMSGRTRAGMTVYYAGNLALLKRPCVAIVGTRKVSDAGEARTRRLARELAQEGVVVVSGLAMGVDTAAHTACIEAGGSTIAVIGTPMDTATPASNRALQELIYKEHLVLSPFPIGSRVQKGNFPQRNQVMAAISDATVVIEASDTSGTLHQSKEAVGLGRWLFIARSCADDPTLAWPQSFLKGRTAKVLNATADIIERVGRAEWAPLRVLYDGSECPDAEGGSSPPSTPSLDDARGLAEQVVQRVKGRRVLLVPVESGGDSGAVAHAIAGVHPDKLLVGDVGDQRGADTPRVLVLDELRDGSPVQKAHQGLRARGVPVPFAVARRRWSWLPCHNASQAFEDTLDNLVHDPPSHPSLTVQIDPVGREAGGFRGLGSLWMPWGRRGDFAAAVKALGTPLSAEALRRDVALGVAAVDLVFEMGQVWFHAVVSASGPPSIASMLRLRKRFFSVRKEPDEIHLMIATGGSVPDIHELGAGWMTAVRRVESLPGALIANFLLDLVLSDWSGRRNPTSARDRLIARLGWSAWGDLRAETRSTETKFSVQMFDDRPRDLEVRAYTPSASPVKP